MNLRYRGNKSGTHIIHKCQKKLFPYRRQQIPADCLGNLIYLLFPCHILWIIMFSHIVFHCRPHGINLYTVIGITKMSHPLLPCLSRRMLQIALIFTDIIDLIKEFPCFRICNSLPIFPFWSIKHNRCKKSVVTGLRMRCAPLRISIYVIKDFIGYQHCCNTQKSNQNSFFYLCPAPIHIYYCKEQ